jgi:hypothetical protein
MHIFRKLEDVSTDFGPTVISVGNFDGVHCAHKKVLGEVVERAQKIGAKSLAITFEPHPTRILRPEFVPLLASSRSLPPATSREIFFAADCRARRCMKALTFTLDIALKAM